MIWSNVLITLYNNVGSLKVMFVSTLFLRVKILGYGWFPSLPLERMRCTFVCNRISHPCLFLIFSNIWELSISIGSHSTKLGILIAKVGVKLAYESKRLWDISTHTQIYICGSIHSQWRNETYVFVGDDFFTRVKLLIHLNENFVPYRFVSKGWFVCFVWIALYQFGVFNTHYNVNPV